VDKGVDDVHGLFRDANIGMHLLEHLVNIDREGLYSSSPGFSVSSRAFSFSSLGHLLLILII